MIVWFNFWFTIVYLKNLQLKINKYLLNHSKDIHEAFYKVPL
jgi:hypothetical protein